MQIIQEKNNLLLKRKEVEATVDSAATPSKTEIAKLVGEHFKKDENCIVVDEVKTSFGTKQALIKAKVYDNIESKNKFETVSRKQKAKIAEEAKKAEEEAVKKAEEAKEAVPQGESA